MTQNQPGFSPEKRPDNDNRKATKSAAVSAAASAGSPPPLQPKRKSMGQRWSEFQISKTAVFWICIVVIAGTMLVGFRWGGWVTSATAEQTATSLANDAVVQRLSAICIAQFQQDPAKADKFAQLMEARTSQQRSYVKEQGWAIMPGDEQADSKVVNECAKQLALLSTE